MALRPIKRGKNTKLGPRVHYLQPDLKSNRPWEVASLQPIL